ncbi:protein of unknown function [Nitrospira japonica]|uniref:Uncharacterized protein n=1 Tax=Nitrospira japonica TaxID=1325564 RepID=A0A1W1I2U1_9BACT|nr:protein of unknown function [Nitrospira japonica]
MQRTIEVVENFETAASFTIHAGVSSSKRCGARQGPRSERKSLPPIGRYALYIGGKHKDCHKYESTEILQLTSDHPVG